MTFKYFFSKCCCMCKKSKNLMINNDELMKNIYIENYIDNACVKDSTSIENQECFFCLENLQLKQQIIRLRCCKQILHESCFQEWSEIELKRQNNNHTTMPCPFCQSKLFQYDLCL